MKERFLPCRRLAWLVTAHVAGLVVGVCASSFAASSSLRQPTSTPAAKPVQHIQVMQATNAVDVYDFLEVTVRPDVPVSGNPFTNTVVEGEFSPVKDGTPLKVDGFCDSQDGSTYKIRFMPAQPGDYRYTVTLRQGQNAISHNGSFTARRAWRHGLLRVDFKHPFHFIWEGTGEHYFWNGTTTYYLMGWQSDAEIRRIIDRLSGLKINRLRVLLYGRNEDRPWGQPVRSTDQFKLYLNPWVAQRPDNVKDPGFDLRRFNVAYWQRYERMLAYARQKGMVISVIPFIGAQVLPTPFAAYSEEEQLYYRYAMARLAAFCNITWDLGNEHDLNREAPKWADWLGPLVKQWDPYDHLLSAHNRIYRTPGNPWNDMQLIQRWDGGGQKDFFLDQRMQQAASGRIVPLVNEEYGYEDLWEKKPGERNAESRRRVAWEVCMAGGYQTTGETANRGTGFPPDSGGGWVNGRGDDAMIMLRGYGHLVDFFTSFDWWRTVPRNDLVRGGAFCLAETGMLYAAYLPRPASVTLTLEPGNYHARWFNPRSGKWRDSPVASGSRWTPPAPPDDGDWALLLRHDPQLRDTAPPAPANATASLSGKEVLVTFTKALDPRSIAAGNFALEPAVAVLAAQPGEEPNTVRLTTGALADGTRYTLTVRDVRDRAPVPNRLTTPARVTFEALDATRPIVELRFNEGRGQVTANTGSSARAHATAALTDKQLAWTTNTPPGGGPSALDFGVTSAARAVELTGEVVSALKGLKSFTLTGWVNCRSTQTGSGGNRIVTVINHGGDGFDLVMLDDGRLQLGVNEWPDGSPAKSSPGQVPANANASSANWRFFAVTYDAARAPGEVKFYFGRADRGATLDTTVAYNRGPVGDDLGPLAVGHFNSRTRADHTDRMFRGLIDDIRVHGSQLDGTGALTREQIQAVVVAELDGLKTANAYGHRQLVTFHPRGGTSSSRWFHPADGLDFNKLQSGHSAQSVNYVPVERDCLLTIQAGWESRILHGVLRSDDLNLAIGKKVVARVRLPLDSPCGNPHF